MLRAAAEWLTPAFSSHWGKSEDKQDLPGSSAASQGGFAMSSRSVAAPDVSFSR